MYTIRPFEPTDAEYEASAAVRNAAWPEDLTTPSTMKHEDCTRDPNFFREQYVVVTPEGAIVAVGNVGQNPWSHQPGKYGFGWATHPDHEGPAVNGIFFEHILERLQLRSERPQKLVTFHREDKTERLAFLREQGFRQTQRDPSSELDVTQFDFERYAGSQERVTAQGIEICNLVQLKERDPEWMGRLHDLEWTLLQDVPMPDPLTRVSDEEYAKEFEHPYHRPEAYFIALAGDGYVGISNLWVNPEQLHKIYVGLTGVLPAYRRRGIATALKVRTIEYARSIGARIIETGNEENNPMYQLNLALGFQPRPAWLGFEKVL